MSTLETVEVKHHLGGTYHINKTDFNADIHELANPPKPAVKPPAAKDDTPAPKATKATKTE